MTSETWGELVSFRCRRPTSRRKRRLFRESDTLVPLDQARVMTENNVWNSNLTAPTTPLDLGSFSREDKSNQRNLSKGSLVYFDQLSDIHRILKEVIHSESDPDPEDHPPTAA